MEPLGPQRRTLGELAAMVGGEVAGDACFAIRDVASLEDAGPDEIAFFANRKYRHQLANTRAGALIVSPHDVALAPAKPLVTTANPYLAFARISRFFHPAQRPPSGIDSGAIVHESAAVDPSATVMALAYVGPGARVGARTVLHPGAVVAAGAAVGDECVLHPSAVVGERCVVGNRVLLQPGAVVGSDGFGYAFDFEKPEHVKVPQLGTARIEDDVELGACACVDRATFGETIVGRGTKVDNLVQIGHNVVVGPMSVLCGQAGVSGSARLGTGVMLGGQVGIAGHITVGDGARFAAQAGVHSDVPAGATLAGAPAEPHREFMRNAAAFHRLADLAKEVRALRRQVAALERSKKGDG